jgi:hypothetical protein
LLGKIKQEKNTVGNERVDLPPDMFQQVQQLTERELFTKFVTSRGVLRSSDFHSLDEMSFHDLAGHHSWLNAAKGEWNPVCYIILTVKGRLPLQPRLAY